MLINISNLDKALQLNPGNKSSAERVADLQTEEPDTDKLTWKKALSLDIDAFLWTAFELERMWKRLILYINRHDMADDLSVECFAVDLFGLVDELKMFADQTREDIETLEEAAHNEQNSVDC